MHSSESDVYSWSQNSVPRIHDYMVSIESRISTSTYGDEEVLEVKPPGTLNLVVEQAGAMVARKSRHGFGRVFRGLHVQKLPLGDGAIRCEKMITL